MKNICHAQNNRSRNDTGNLRAMCEQKELAKYNYHDYLLCKSLLTNRNFFNMASDGIWLAGNIATT